MDEPLTSGGPARYAPAPREPLQLRRYGIKIALFRLRANWVVLDTERVKGTPPACDAHAATMFRAGSVLYHSRAIAERCHTRRFAQLQHEPQLQREPQLQSWPPLQR